MFCKMNSLPPDPEQLNESRASWGQAAIQKFQITTGTNWDDALPDLLCDLMHWADRATMEDGVTKIDFDESLEKARMNYEAETSEDE